MSRKYKSGLLEGCFIEGRAQADACAMMGVVDAYYDSTKTWHKYGETFIGTATGNVHGYKNTSYPKVTSAATLDVNRYLTVTYYDNYLFKNIISDSASYSFKVDELSGEQDATFFKRLAGQVTGTKIKVLDGGIAGGITWLKSVNYYDDNYRMIQNVSGNYKGGTDRSTNVYDFAGKVLKTKTTHLEADVTWNDLVGVTSTGNILTRTAGTAGAASKQVLNAGIDGWVEFTVSEINTTRYLGLNDSNPDVAATNINYALKLTNATLTVVENNGSAKATVTNIIPGDILRIERVGTLIKYFRNGAQITVTTGTASTTQLMVDVSTASTNGSWVGVRSSFSSTTHAMIRRFEYDHAGRLLKTWHQLDTQPEILLTKNEYNELGQLVDKKLHSTVSSAANAKQSVDYRYNIRGWLTRMNESDLTGGDSGEARDLFGMELGYNADIGVSNTSLFNGNISAIKWSSNLALGTVKENAYLYSYDALNRIAGSTFKEKGGSWSAPANNTFAETGFTYDLNGNIKTLQRNDKRASGWMDNLAYDYGSGATASNKLLKVTDTGDDFAGFLDGNPGTGTDYTYDGNGNMITDQNKGITTAITYNLLNLPEKVVRNNSNVAYIYDATGRKLTQVFNSATAQKQTDYVGEYVYENDALKFISHEEGRIVLQESETILYEDGSSTANFTPSAGFTNTTVTINGETYVKVTPNVGIALTKLGTTPIRGNISVTAGERYVYRVKGYSNSTKAAYLYVKGNSSDIVWPGANLPTNSVGQMGVENTFTVPAGVTQISVGVLYSSGTSTASDYLYINAIELRKLTTSAPEYQYNLKDHLGNVRLTFTTKQEEETSIATLETANVATEQSQFTYYDEAVKINSPLFDHTNNGATNYATRLTGGTTNEKYGLVKTLSVMPGDTLNIEVFAKYLDPTSTNWNAALQAFIASIQPGGGAPAGTFIDGGATGSIGSQTFPYIGTLTRANDNGTGPKGYLNYILFDRNFVYKTGGFQRISSTPKETGTDDYENIYPTVITVAVVGVITYEVVKWGIAIFLVPETLGGSLAAAAAMP